MSWNSQFFGQLPSFAAGAGVKTPFGLLLPPGGNVAAYVRSTGAQDYDESAIKARLVPTLAQGLNKCRAGLGDTVVVLPGHSESVADATMLDNLRAGCNIVGIGQGSTKPTFRWTATGGKWLVDDANVRISGLKLQMEGANGVVKALEITASGFLLEDCDIEVASDATAKAAIAIEIGSGATHCTIRGNYLYGTETHNVTDGIKVVGGTVPSDLKICGNVMLASATAANGLVHVTVAAKRVMIMGNTIYNTHTASTACVAVDAVAADGVIAYNNVATVNNGAASGQGITLGAGALFRAFQNFSSDEPVKSGVLAPVVVAT